MRRTILYVILVAVIVAVIAGVVIRRARLSTDGHLSTDRRQTESLEGEARSAVVERGTMLVAVSASGSIEPEVRVSLVFQTPGRVADAPVEVGDVVAAGDVLARLDSEQLALQVEQAQAALTSARARLAQLQAGARQEEIAAAEANLRAVEFQVDAASANLAQLYAGATGAQIAAAEADHASALVQQILAEDAHEMTMKCFTFSWGGEERTICPALGDPEIQARYSLGAADKALTAAQASLDEMVAGADADQVRAAQANVAAAQAQRDATQAQLDLLLAGATDGEIAATEAQVEQARVALELAELALEKGALHAPFDGVVAAVNVTAGEMALAGPLPAVTLLDTCQFRMMVGVDEIDVGRLVVGQTAQVTLDALPDVVITGVVERVAPVATIDEGGVVYYNVVIELEPTDAPIRADMTANATIVVQELGDVLMIPTWVVRVDDSTGQTYVNQRVGDEVVRTDVELGIRYAGSAQVLDGLSEGDEAIWVSESGFGFGPH